MNDRFVEVSLDGAIANRRAHRRRTAEGAARRAVQWRTIVGVMPTIRQQGAGGVDQQSPVVYLPIAAASPATSMLMVRHTLDPDSAPRLLRAEVQAIDPNVPLYRMRTLAHAVADAQWNRRVSAYLAAPSAS